MGGKAPRGPFTILCSAPFQRSRVPSRVPDSQDSALCSTNLTAPRVGRPNTHESSRGDVWHWSMAAMRGPRGGPMLHCTITLS